MNKVLLVIAILIFIANFVVSPLIFKQEPDNTGTFVGLVLLCIIISNLIKEK